jgi:hypothetical protein
MELDDATTRPERKNWSPISPTDEELDAIDAHSGSCRVSPGPLGGSAVLVSDLTAEIRRHREAARSILSRQQVPSTVDVKAVEGIAEPR